MSTREKPPLFVYIIEAHNGWVKIGNTENPHARLQSINLHSPIPARLIAFWEGRMKDELALHRMFEFYRRHNEWFECRGELAEFVKQKSGIGLDKPVLEWAEVIFPPRTRNRAATAVLRSNSMKKRWADPETKKDWLIQLANGRRWKRERMAAMSPAPSEASAA